MPRGDFLLRLKTYARLVLAAGLVATCFAATDARAADAGLKILPNGTRHQFCDVPEAALYQRGDTAFCAPAGAKWPKRVTYVVLGDDLAPYRGDLDAAVAQAERLSGTTMATGPDPDFILVFGTKRWSEAEVRARAAQAGVHLGAYDVHEISYVLGLILVPDKAGESRGAGGTEESGGRKHTRSVFDAREEPGTPDQPADKAAFKRWMAKEIRKKVLDYFDIEAPFSEPIQHVCSQLVSGAKTPPAHPPTLADGTRGLTCDATRTLYETAGGAFCAPRAEEWPRSAGYAVVGPGKAAHAADVAAAVAHVRDLTGSAMVESATPDMLLLLVDGPLTDAQLQDAIRQSGVRPSTGTAGDFLGILKSLMVSLYPSVESLRKQAGIPPPVTYLQARSEMCGEVSLQYVIRTDASAPSAIRKHIDDAFLVFFGVTPAKQMVPGAAGVAPK